MSLTQAQVQFAAEFIALVVAASALFLVLMRPTRRWGGWRWMNVAGLCVLVGAAFAHGALLVTGDSVRWIGLARLVGALVVAVSVVGPRGRLLRSATARARAGQAMAHCGLLLWAGAGVAQLLLVPVYPVSALLFAGSLISFASPLVVSQRSVYVRVATSSAVAMLLVVVILALSLSTVITSSVRGDQLTRLDDRVGIEKAELIDTQAITLAAQLVEADLAGAFGRSPTNPLVDFATGTEAKRQAARVRISRQLATVDEVSGVGYLAYRSTAGQVALVSGAASGTSTANVTELVAEPVFIPKSCHAGVQGLFVVGQSLVQAATSPECTADGRLLGAIVVTRPVNAAYLKSRQQVDTAVSLAVVSGSVALGTAGLDHATAVDLATHMAARLHPTGASAEEVGGHYVSVAQVTAESRAGPVPVTVVAASSTSAANPTQSRLFRTLFFIAFGGTLLALGLAVYASDRITAGVRRLTRVATAIQAGEVSVRAEIQGRDEVASLGAAFDSMVDSVTATSAALSAAVEDETRMRSRLEAVVAGMSDALVAVGPDGIITDFNLAATQLTGIPAAEAIGAPAASVLDVHIPEAGPGGDDVGPGTDELFRVGSEGVRLFAEVRAKGVAIPVAIATGVVRGTGSGGSDHSPEGVGQVLVLRDLRHDLEVEQMKTEFLSRVGHELRTPLTGIIGYAEIMSRRSVSQARVKTWSAGILSSARKLARIVEMLEFFATEGAGRAVMSQEHVDARDLVTSITSAWSDSVPDNLTISRRVSRDSVVVTADRRWLTMAIDELLDNAVKFSPDGGRIAVRVTRDDGQVVVSVSDQGVGMTPEQYEAALGDFVQVDSSDTRSFGGLGLGLAVVRRVVERHGGTMECESAPGKGTTFFLSLPAADGA